MSVLTRRFIRKGERCDEISTAGEDFWKYSALGLHADVFMTDRRAQVPLIRSDNPGSGHLDAFLLLLKAEFGESLLFVSVINKGLAKHLDAMGIKWQDESGVEPWLFPKTRNA